MEYYYVVLQSKTHAFLLERKLKENYVVCELSQIPRQIKKELCDMGVKFSANQFQRAIGIIKSSGLSGYKVFSEKVSNNTILYYEVSI